MATLESHKYSDKKPKAFINEIERRILDYFQTLILNNFLFIYLLVL